MPEVELRALQVLPHAHLDMRGIRELAGV